MFSCGTGITPFYYILSNMPATSRYNCLLNASFRSKNDALLVDKLTNTKINLFFSEENNKLTEEKAKEIIDSFDDKLVLVCGTKSFNDMISHINVVVKCYEW
jgi:predicted ferric reductase